MTDTWGEREFKRKTITFGNGDTDKKIDDNTKYRKTDRKRETKN